MKKILLLAFVCFSFYGFAQTNWTGPKMTFAKTTTTTANEADQDRITDKVWITRATSKGIFNIKSEVSYEGKGTSGNSPADTEWAFGTLADGVSTLTFGTWASHVGVQSISNILNKNMVVHLISEDIYIDIKFTAWGGSGSGTFTYERSTQSTVTNTTLAVAENASFYPNPVSDVLYITGVTEETAVEIFDITGSLVLVTLTTESVDVSNLNTGVYFVKIGAGQVERLIKD